MYLKNDIIKATPCSNTTSDCMGQQITHINPGVGPQTIFKKLDKPCVMSPTGF